MTSMNGGKPSSSFLDNAKRTVCEVWKRKDTRKLTTTSALSATFVQESQAKYLSTGSQTAAVITEFSW